MWYGMDLNVVNTKLFVLIVWHNYEYYIFITGSQKCLSNTWSKYCISIEKEAFNSDTSVTTDTVYDFQAVPVFRVNMKMMLSV